LRIPCPCCGERDIREFSYLGDASARRPDPASGEAPFFEYVYLRENRAGEIHEFWYHAAGCRSWLIVKRHTVTHKVTGAWRAAGGARGARG
jgi:sarcosine oxidase subunit delta